MQLPMTKSEVYTSNSDKQVSLLELQCSQYQMFWLFFSGQQYLYSI